MKVLHILSDGSDETAASIIAQHTEVNDVEIIDLMQMDISYAQLVDRIEQCERVISWLLRPNRMLLFFQRCEVYERRLVPQAR